MKRYCLYILLLLVTASALAIEAPTFSETHGYKNSPFTLSISSPTNGCSIYYTLDCTTPSATNGILYTEPILIDKTSVLRAIAISSTGSASETTSAT